MAVFRSSPDTFFVEELPAYAPSGVGDHTFLWIEKRGLTTIEAIKRLARRLNVPEREVGYAGMKDRHATTRQWISVPAVDPQTVRGIVEEAVDGVWRVLEAERHGNKLRTGHLRGNRFEVVLTEVEAGEVEPVRAALAAVGRVGLSNRYGEQRFGASKDNVTGGLAILRGQRRERDKRRRRLLLSALQSAVFNRALELRQQTGLLRVRVGDVLQKVVSGGLFVCEDCATDQARVDAGEIVPTGPMPGTREMKPPPGSEAGILEDQALAEVGLTPGDLAAAGRELPGARRPVVVPVTLGEPPVDAVEGQMKLRFSLTAGSYATVLLQELALRAAPAAILKVESGAPQRL